MADRLDELVTSQRRFVADASHQLRTPLTALRLRLENLDADDPSAVATTRDAALLETSRLTRLVDGLLALARAEGRRPERQDVDLAAVVAQRFEAWAPLAAEHDIDLQLDCAGPVSAMVVPGHLDQILDNLIDNALDATPPGHGVQLRTAATSSIIEIHVVDEGRGMTADDRRRAFDPFWQGPQRHANGGTGLGLAIADQLVRANGGTIVLEPSGSGGIDATLRFPRPAPHPNPGPKPKPPGPRGPGPRPPFAFSFRGSCFSFRPGRGGGGLKTYAVLAMEPMLAALRERLPSDNQLRRCES